MAWANKVRNRLVLKDAKREGDPELRELSNPKANYSVEGDKLELRWHRGCFVRDVDLPEDQRAELKQTARASADNGLFLACLRLRTDQRRAVSDKPSPTYAPRVFSKMPESKGIGVPRLDAAMDRLFRTGAIERGELGWKTADRKLGEGLRETER